MCFVCVCVGVLTYICRCLLGPEEGNTSPRAGATGACESSDMDAGNWAVSKGEQQIPSITEAPSLQLLTLFLETGPFPGLKLTNLDLLAQLEAPGILLPLSANQRNDKHVARCLTLFIYFCLFVPKDQ